MASAKRDQIIQEAEKLAARGKLDAAIKQYMRAVDQAPGDTNTLNHLGDLLVRVERIPEAIGVYQRIAEHFAADGFFLKSIAIYKKVNRLDPRRTETYERLADLYFKQGLAIEGRQQLLTLADWFMRSKQPQDAMRVFRRLVEHEPSHLQARARTDVSQLFADVMIKSGIAGDLKGRPLSLVDRLLQARDVARAATLVKKLMASAPGDPEVLKRALKVFEQLDDAEAVVGVERDLADAYFVAGRRAEAASLYHRLAAKAPGPASALEPGAGPPEPPPAAGLTEPSLGPANLEELFTEAVVFAKYGLTDKAVAHLQRLLALDPAHTRGRELLASLGGEPAEAEGRQPEPSLAPALEPGAPPAKPLAPAQRAAAGVPDGAREAFAAFSQLVPLPPAPVREDGAPANPASALELSLPVPGLDLSALGGPVPAAGQLPEFHSGAPLPSFDDLLAAPPVAPARAEPARPAARSVRLDDLEAMLGLRQPPVLAPADEEPVETPDEAMKFVEVAGVLAGPGEDQLRELDFLIQQGLLDDAAKLLQKVRAAFADHPDVLARQAMLKARGWDEDRRGAAVATAAELFSEEEQFFDLAAELEKELADEEMVAEATGSGKGTNVSIEDLFKEFQRGVAEQVEEEDFDTHFNLGLAYREMGLLDEAIGEFQLSAKSSDYLVESASMIGACYIEKGLPDQGAEWYQRALTAPVLPPEAELGLRYELGRAHELAGNTTAALGCFSEVLAINPAFRDVVARVSKLRSN